MCRAIYATYRNRHNPLFMIMYCLQTTYSLLYFLVFEHVLSFSVCVFVCIQCTAIYRPFSYNGIPSVLEWLLYDY